MRKLTSLIAVAGVAMVVSARVALAAPGWEDPEYLNSDLGHRRVAGVTIVPSDQGFGGLNPNTGDTMGAIPRARGMHSPAPATNFGGQGAGTAADAWAHEFYRAPFRS